MELNELARQAARDSKRWFPNADHNVVLGALCLAGEAGEFCNEIKKVMRQSPYVRPQLKGAALEEFIDIFTYVLKLAGENDIDLEAEYNKKRDKNNLRWAGRVPEHPDPRLGGVETVEAL